MTRNRVLAEDVIEAAAEFVGDCPDAAFVVAADGTVVAWNAQASHLFGIPASEAGAQNCAAVVCGRSPDGAVLCAAGCPLLTGAAEPVPGPVSMRVRCGGRHSSRLVQVQHVPIKDPLGGATTAMVHLVDGAS